MKVTITEKGVFDADGERIPVGTEIEVKGEVLPGPLVGKCQEVGKAKKAVTNPKDGGDEELQALKARADELGIEYAGNIGAKKLAEKIAAAEKGE